MAEQTIFFTGGGGFIGRYILAHYLNRTQADLVMLENGKFCDRLRAFLDGTISDPAKRARVTIVEGDITSSRLGINGATLDELKAKVTQAIHLAALYNLSAPRDVSMKVNVEGTRNVLDFIGSVKNFDRLGYMSTVAVSGSYSGTFTEEDLDKGQSFRNFYAETKFLAEKLVRERRSGIPTVICRPTVVVGDSRTGAIEKVDGPYYGLTMILRNLHLINVDSGPTKCHIAPVDYVAEAFFTLMEEPTASGRVYCLGDPDPMTYAAFFDLVYERWGKMKPIVKLPPAMMRPFTRLPFFYEITGVTAEAFEYTVNPVEYPVTNATMALARSGLKCPPVPSYIDAMLSYFRLHHRDPKVRHGDWKKSTT